MPQTTNQPATRKKQRATAIENSVKEIANFPPSRFKFAGFLAV
jgi:hypothetical protein